MSRNRKHNQGEPQGNPLWFCTCSSLQAFPELFVVFDPPQGARLRPTRGRSGRRHCCNPETHGMEPMPLRPPGGCSFPRQERTTIINASPFHPHADKASIHPRPPSPAPAVLPPSPVFSFLLLFLSTHRFGTVLNILAANSVFL